MDSRARTRLEELAERRWWIAALPVAALLLVAAITADWRWIIVAAMVLFVLFPMAVMFVWIKILADTATPPSSEKSSGLSAEKPEGANPSGASD